MEKSTFVPSELTSKASQALEIEIEEELKLQDPTSEQAKATLENLTRETNQ